MLFNSLEFLLFFPIVTALYFVLPKNARWVLLLLASYFFYMCWEPGYLGPILASTVVDLSGEEPRILRAGPVVWTVG